MGKTKKPNAIIADTNVYIHDPESIDALRAGGNTLFIPSTVLYELDNLKARVDIGCDVREAIRRIEVLQNNKDKSLKILKKPSWARLGHLNRDDPDHQIVAYAHTVKRNNNGDFREVKVVSRDIMVRILSKDVGLYVEDYWKDKTDVKEESDKLPRLNVPWDIIRPNFTFDVPENCTVPINGGVVCCSDWNGIFDNAICANQQWEESFAAIRNGSIFKIIPKDQKLFGLSPYTMNGYGVNWEQYIAMAQLLDPKIRLVFLKGGTGSGKTLLSLAAALEQRRDYRNIFITRPMIPLDDDDRMGFLPGSTDEKLGPWIRPVWRALSVIGDLKKENAKLIASMKEKGKISIEPLDYIRGMTYVKDWLVIDEAQNLTPHQVKTLITRNGEFSKMIFTGDLGQVDRRKRLGKRSNGLTYASTRMNNHPIVAVSNFKKTVRSELANIAEELL